MRSVDAKSFSALLCHKTSQFFFVRSASVCPPPWNRLTDRVLTLQLSGRERSSGCHWFSAFVYVATKRSFRRMKTKRKEALGSLPPQQKQPAKRFIRTLFQSRQPVVPRQVCPCSSGLFCFAGRGSFCSTTHLTRSSIVVDPDFCAFFIKVFVFVLLALFPRGFIQPSELVHSCMECTGNLGGSATSFSASPFRCPSEIEPHKVPPEKGFSLQRQRLQKGIAFHSQQGPTQIPQHDTHPCSRGHHAFPSIQHDGGPPPHNSSRHRRAHRDQPGPTRQRQR